MDKWCIYIYICISKLSHISSDIRLVTNIIQIIDDLLLIGPLSLRTKFSEIWIAIIKIQQEIL